METLALAHEPVLRLAAFAAVLAAMALWDCLLYTSPSPRD